MAKKQTRKDSKGKVLEKNEYQRKDGIYIYTYYDVFKKRRTIYAGSLTELRLKERNLQRKEALGIDAYASGKETLNVTFDRYISTKNNLRSTTRANYIYMYDRFIRDGIGKRLVADIKYSDIKNFYLSLLNKQNLQVNTLETIHTILHPTFSMAYRDDVIFKNPSDGVMAEIKKSSKKNTGVRHALTVKQQLAFMKAINDVPEFEHWNLIFTVLLGTGCRVGEAIGLRWSDVDFENRTISINHSATYYVREDRKAMFGISLPKTKAGIRTIPMMESVYQVLTSEYERQLSEGFSKYELDGMKGFIFTNRNGTLHNPHCLNQAIRRISDTYNMRETVRAKREHREPVLLPHFSCHHLRHTFCSRLCESDVNIKVIQEIMGHANIETTLQIYAEVSQEKKKEALEYVAEVYDVFNQERVRERS